MKRSQIQWKEQELHAENGLFSVGVTEIIVRVTKLLNSAVPGTARVLDISNCFFKNQVNFFYIMVKENGLIPLPKQRFQRCA
jgi:hypothetical protein